VVAFLLACAHAPPVQEAPVPELHAQAVAGVEDPALRSLLHDHWEATMARYPEWSTRLGDGRYDDRLTDRSTVARTRWIAQEQAWLDRAEALTPATRADQVTVALFREELAIDLAKDACRYEQWAVSARNNPLSWASWLPGPHPVDALPALQARYRALPASFEQAAADLLSARDDGLVANAESLRRVVEMLDRELALPLADWALVTQLPDHTDTAPFLEALAGLPEAVAAYRNVVRDEILPHGRTGAEVGLVGLPEGERCYELAIREYTGLPLTPDELHATGLRELERVHDGFRELGETLWGETDLEAIFARLRDDPELRFATAEEVEQTARDAVARAGAALPQVLGVVPDTPCEVEPIPAFEAPYTTVAYYRQPPGDGSGPGTYFINVHAPETRPRFEAEALAWHEAIPGHHTQIALAQSLGDLPAFRRYGGHTAFVEGWALYAESLADELGLYTGLEDQLGRYSFDAWRAARLVVDTGVHARGWTREEAKDFLASQTPLALNNIDNEVDRYISWPGQALAYMTGRLWIEELRAEAEAALGEGFDLRAFHDRVLGGGAVSLPVLREEVEAWVAEQASGSL